MSARHEIDWRPLEPGVEVAEVQGHMIRRVSRDPGSVYYLLPNGARYTLFADVLTVLRRWP